MKLNIKFTALAAVFIAALMLLTPISQINTSGGGGTNNYDLDFLNSLDVNNNNFVLSADQNSYSNTVSISEITSSSEGVLYAGTVAIPDTTAITVSNTNELEILSDIVNGTYDPNKSQQPIKSDFSGYTVILTANLSLAVLEEGQSNFTPIGKDEQHAFNGTFDGQKHTISNLSVNITSDSNNLYTGLFGVLEVDSIIKNLGIVDSSISATATSVDYLYAPTGGIVGENYGTIMGCYNTGYVSANSTSESGDADSGGIAGSNDGTIINCHNTGGVNSSAYSGGIAGNNNGTIANCYNTGAVTGSSNSGGIAGENNTRGIITSCYNAGIVTGAYGGGIVGENYAIITNCYNTGVVTASSRSGGIAGYNNGGTITSCYNAEIVTFEATSANTYAYSGGITGENDGTITNCYNMGSVTATSESGDAYLGGIAGSNNDGIITNCYNTGTVVATSTDNDAYSGGIAGDNPGGKIKNCYNKGILTATSTNGSAYSGGIVGDSWGRITNCYSIGTVNSSAYSGGIAGHSESTITNCYWSGNIPDGVGDGTKIDYDGKINEQGQVDNSYLYTLLNEWVTIDYGDDGEYYLPWTEDTYPEFEIKHPEKNDDGIYEIKTADDLILVNNDLDGNYILMNDIDLSEFKEWAPIGGSALFNGTFDGNGYIISNMTITGDMNYAGLFGCIGEDGIVKNVGLVESSIDISSSDEDAYAGGITGRNNGTITNCYNTGAVTVNSIWDDAYSGGIAGRNSGTIENCYNTGTVAANVTSESDSPYSGGIAGENNGTIENCYNLGSVTATSTWDNTYSGGITGENYGTIENCYNTGNVITTITSDSSDDGSKDNYASSGGIVGDNWGLIENCYNIGAVETTSTNNTAYLGGIVGSNNIDKKHGDVGTIANCYNIGTVTVNPPNNNAYLGGIAGSNDGTITNCYYLGTDNSIEGTTNLSKDDMTGLKLLGVGSSNNLNKEQDSKPWSPDIFNVNDGYPILADVPTQLDPKNSTNKIPQSAVYILSETEDTQTDNYLELITSSVLSAKTIETTWESLTNPQYNWYIYGSDESQGSDATIDIAEFDKLIVYYVTISYNIDNVEYKYTSLTRSVCNTQSTPPQPPPTPPPYDPTPSPTPDPEPKPIVPDENNNITVPPIDEEKTEELINEAVSSGSDSISIIDTNNVEGEYTEVTVSKSDLETISKKIENNNNINSVSIETSEGDIIIEKEVLNSILETTDADSVSFEIEDAKDKLTEEQKEAVGDRPVYDINIKAGNENITSFNGKTITISLPYTLKAGEDPENIVIYYVKEDGSLEKVNCTYKDGKVIFETDHLSKYVMI